MCKKNIPLTVLSGVLATINPAEAKVTRCQNDSGHVTFSDKGCTNQDDDIFREATDPRPLFPTLPDTNPPSARKIHFYSHSGTQKFTKC